MSDRAGRRDLRDWRGMRPVGGLLAEGRAVDDIAAHGTIRAPASGPARPCARPALSPVARMEIDGNALADELFRAYLKQILIDGFFHADPHPGNVFVTDDQRLALIDLGMVARISPEMQEKLLKLLIAVSEGRSDEAAGQAIEIGRKQERFDAKELDSLSARLGEIASARSRSARSSSSCRASRERRG